MVPPINRLIKKGVHIPNPESIDIGPEVNTDRISGEQVVIHSGCKLFGEKTLILPGTRLGYEAPVTLNDCQLGPNVQLKGGFFENSVFLGDNQFGSGAHVRSGTILEEQANGAHTVALKQTVLFPFVTLGSLINFCDCLMSGGTSRQNHSEVGSSYIHFNYTPNQDKATPSLLGDIPRGVMLDQPPIFLCGQGGLVGPCRIDFGNVIAAGSIYRKDVTGSSQLLIGSQGRGGRVPFKKGIYPNVKRVFYNNIIYIANLLALLQWYRHIRGAFISNRFPQVLYEGLIGTLGLVIQERKKRIDQFIALLPTSLANLTQTSKDETTANTLLHRDLINNRSAIMETLKRCEESTAGNVKMRDRFVDELSLPMRANGNTYITTIQKLESSAKEAGTQWLTGIVDEVTAQISALLPSLVTQSR